MTTHHLSRGEDQMFRSFSRRRATLAMLATAAAVPAFAASAQATLGPVSGSTSIPRGQVTLETVPFGLIGSLNPDGVSDVSLMSAESKFTWYNGAVAGHVTGTMHVDNGQLAQYRVRVDGLTGNNDVLSTSYDAKRGTSPTSASQDIPVDVAVPAAPNLLKAKVVLEEKSSGPNWVERGELYTQAVPRTDDVKILSRHLDVGGIGFANGEPTDDASVTWDIGDDGALTATYRGYLHFTGAAASGRVELRSINPLLGGVSDTADGDTHETNGNGPVTSPQDTIALTSSSSPTVDVVMQSWVPDPNGGHWDDIASQRVSAGE
jgi:hypothetical protein